MLCGVWGLLLKYIIMVWVSFVIILFILFLLVLKGIK